ncbi:EPIDERMAL PATTERNING FACTOR-like protein [Drosera capensis]
MVNVGSSSSSSSSSSLNHAFVLIIISPLLYFLFFAPCTVYAVPTASPAQRMMRMRTMMMVEEKEKALIIGEKTRLGSTPPTCHNKCNQCHPCWAVQVPTLPSHDGEELNHRRRQDRRNKNNGRKFVAEFYDDVDFGRYGSGSGGNRYSNYKPLGWQCLCREQFFNP